MLNKLKNIFYKSPKFIRVLILKTIEFLALIYTILKVGKLNIKKQNKNSHNKKNILIYHITALSFGGTEKNLQLIAKYLNKDKYNVYILHATDKENNRLDYLKNENVNIINFSYSKVEKHWPYVIHDMNPTIDTVINDHNIDIIISATPGQTIYPLIQIRNIPIILLNIFGSFNTQKNILKNICLSPDVKIKGSVVIDDDKLSTQYIPSERPIINKDKSKNIRERFVIKDNELVFGRIGRSDNSIFDPIGLLAFEITVKKYLNIHYIIMSPAPDAIKLVKERNIPNIHWLDPSYKEEDVWAFHEAIDVLAHFRRDGESFGLNIAESMLVGNPILTHKSHIWNSHLEYLEDSFSKYSEQDDYIQYSNNMIYMIDLYNKEQLKEIGEKAKIKAERLFLIENVIKNYEQIIEDSYDNYIHKNK